MPLPANVKTKIQVTNKVDHSHVMLESQENILSANNIVRHSAARMIDEPSPQQARAIDKILRLPK